VEPSLSSTADSHRRPKRAAGRASVFAYPRDFLDNHFVYVVISPRARGLSVGVNVNPDGICNFDCLYCEVDRSSVPLKTALNTKVMATELQRTLALITTDRLQGRAPYQSLPPELLQLRHVTLSGDGEPTLAPNFVATVEQVVHVRALGKFPFFKIVLATNATGLDLPQVQQGLKLFTESDEIWAKLDGGSIEYLNRIARPHNVSWEKTFLNILTVARRRPVIIQSLFPTISGEDPPESEIEEYTQRLKALATAGAQIPLVQIYSATRPMTHAECNHLPLKTLSRIAQTVRQVTGLNAEVF
jgi:wyosine [tRNA(Phe)-imidazoG37] synthetase (radical SAM superfamily)